VEWARAADKTAADRAADGWVVPWPGALSASACARSAAIVNRTNGEHPAWRNRARSAAPRWFGNSGKRKEETNSPGNGPRNRNGHSGKSGELIGGHANVRSAEDRGHSLGHRSDHRLPPCLNLRSFRTFIETHCGILVVIGTHPIPLKYLEALRNLLFWDATDMPGLAGQWINEGRDVMKAYNE